MAVGLYSLLYGTTPHNYQQSKYTVYSLVKHEYRINGSYIVKHAVKTLFFIQLGPHCDAVSIFINKDMDSGYTCIERKGCNFPLSKPQQQKLFF